MEPRRRVAMLRKRAPDPVQRQQRIRPPVAGTKDIPRSHERRGHPALAQQPLPFGAYGDVVLHHRSRLRNREIDEVSDARPTRSTNRFTNRDEINPAKLFRLRRRRMRHTDELNERVTRCDEVRERIAIQRIANDHLRASREFADGRRAHERAHGMAARDQLRNKMTTDVSRGSGDEDVHGRTTRQERKRTHAPILKRSNHVMSLSAPLLSAFDPEVSSEGGIDPFSLSATYERLAERILPFLTVRMSRPRFLTAMAVGAELCRDFGDVLASDGKTPPWLVFEWHVVEAFLRTGDGLRANDDGWGYRIPGVRKVRAAVEGGQSVGASSYLKTPKIFGFTGIYRRLAFGLDILDEDLRLAEGGRELLTAWEAERNLAGFMTGFGAGGVFRQELRRAVSQAMTRGCTCQSKSWIGWQQIAEHLRPDDARRKEANVLAKRLGRTDLRQNPHDSAATQMRAELFEALNARSTSVDDLEEPHWFRSLRRKCSPAMAERLDAIDAFEGVCVVVMGAFNLIRFLSARTATPVTAEDFTGYRGPRNAAKLLAEMAPALERLERSFDAIGFRSQAEPLLKQYDGVRSHEELFARVIEHHESAQSAKPPDGKRSWFDRDDRGVIVRPLYRFDDAPAGGDLYTHPYRSSTALSFLRDLRRRST